MAGKVTFTTKRIEGFQCPQGKNQDFLWDADAKASGLGVRVTPAGKPAFIFQGRYQNGTIRITIGSIEAWTIPDARKRARELQQIIDSGRDPRAVIAAQAKNDAAVREAAKLDILTVKDAWNDYLETRKPDWSDNHHRDQVAMAQSGGEPRPRWKGVMTKPGPLAPLMDRKLSDIDAQTLEKWASREIKKRPSSTRLALRHFKAFLRWASEQKSYSKAVNTNSANSKLLARIVGKDKARTDNLQKEQLPAWFTQVRSGENLVICAYLQCLLLTGARREELAKLKWSDVDFRWNSLAIADKVEGGRIIPLTPYVAHLIKALPRRNQWVFSSTTSKTGRLINPVKVHDKAVNAAALELSLHGLRRSFKSLSEWQEIPVGVVAQIMGHKPSATAEKHYTVRPLDLLRVHHEKMEAWILENAGIEFKPEATPGLSVVK